MALIAPGGARVLAQTCVADCNSDAEVTLGEVQTAFNVFLGSVLPEACAGADANGDDEVTLGEVQTAFNQFLGGCTEQFRVDGPDAVQVATKVGVQTVGVFRVLSFGRIGVRGGGGGASGRRWRLAAAPRVGKYGDAPREGGGAVLIPCRRGTQDVACAPNGAVSVRTITYAMCEERDESGNTRLRNGFLAHTVEDPNFCQTLEVEPGVSVTTELRDFSETLSTADGGLIARRSGTVTTTLDSPGDGCAGANGTESIDGTFEFQCDPAVDPECAPSISDVRVRAGDLRIERRSEGEPCVLFTEVTGELEVENRITQDRFTQVFESVGGVGFTLIEIAQSDGASLITENGSLSIDCLGAVRIGSDPESPVRFGGAAADCPSAGELRVTLEDDSAFGGLVVAGDRPSAAFSATSAVGGGVAFSSANGLEEHAFRAANGEVYQVVQNPAGNQDLGIDDFRITTLVGAADAVARCDSSQGSLFIPQAVVATSPGAAFELSDVVRSGVLPLASTPCFNPNANDGAGVVCLGEGCTGDCRCEAGCASFTIGQGSSLAAGAGAVPAAQVASLGALRAPCSGFAGQEAYGLGSAQPTTEAERCAAAPGDGLTLARGRSLIVAYPAPFSSMFQTGSAGLAIDADGGTECGGSNVVLTGAANRNELPPARARFRAAQSLDFDFNGDESEDRAFGSCLDIRAVPCLAAPPSPVPTPPDSPPCPQVNLESLEVLTRRDSTRDQPNGLGGATCGGGGNGSSERSFGFTAPRAGFYTFDTLNTDGLSAAFDTLLYVRDGGCRGAELGCNDNGETGILQSRVGVMLAAGQRVTVIVDGAAVAAGEFVLSVSRADEAPTPTVTPTRTPPADLPDLVVDAVTAPAAGNIGSTLQVAATVRNQGGAPAGPSELAFVYARNPELSDGRVSSGSSCAIGALLPGASDGCALPIPIPASLTAGTYFVGAVADASGQVDESDEANGERASSAVVLSGAVASLTPTRPATVTASATATRTPTATSIGQTPTVTVAPTNTATIAPSVTSTPTPTDPGGASPTPSRTVTITRTTTSTVTSIPSPTRTVTATTTPTSTPTRTRTPTRTPFGTPAATRVCAPAADPCIVSSVVALSGVSDVNLGQRELRIVSGGSIGAAGATITIEAGHIDVQSGGSITVSSGAASGGSLVIFAQSVSLSGAITASGIPGGEVRVEAAGLVSIGGALRADGTGVQGGTVTIVSGAINASGVVSARSPVADTLGGQIAIRSRSGVTLDGAMVDASGGDGGDVRLEAGSAFGAGNIEIGLDADVAADAIGQAGFGGLVEILAFGDGVDDGNIVIRGALSARGTSGTFDTGGGRGGDISTLATGMLSIQAAMNAMGGAPDGEGGKIDLAAAKKCEVEAPIAASAGGTESNGGFIGLDCEDIDIALDASLGVSAANGGDITLKASHMVTLRGFLDAGTTVGGGKRGGANTIRGGDVTIAGGMTAEANHVSGCSVVVCAAGTCGVTGTAVVTASGAGGLNRLEGRNAIQVLGSLVAADGAQNVLVYDGTPSRQPVVSGAVTPPPTVIVNPTLQPCASPTPTA